MPNSRFYSSIAAATNLQVTAAPTDTSIQVASSVGWPSSFPFILSLDYGAANEELVLVTSGGPSIFTVTRAYDGTSASTHNAGAVVRHVSSAVDFTDSRTHEASNTGVHGISGSFVDTNSTQTISNKTLSNPTINSATVTGTVSGSAATYSGGIFTGSTLNSPAINTPTTSGGSLSGTISGSPTLSGNPTFSGQLNSTGLIESTQSGATNISYGSAVTGDAINRFAVRANGTHLWGDGANPADTTLTRSGSAALSLTGSFAASSDITSSGDMTWAGIPWITYTPSWTATTSNPVLGLGGTLSGRYKQYGKTVVLAINVIPGTTGFFRGTGNYSLSLPFAAANQGITYVGHFHALSNTGAGRWMGQHIISPGVTATSGFVPEVSGGNATGKAVFWKEDTPFVVQSGDQFRFSAVYEIA